MSDFAGDRQNAKQQQVARDLSIARKQAVELLMSTTFGRKYVWDELAQAHIFSISYVPDSFDRTAFQEGERNVGQRLLSDVQRWCPNEYLIAVRENASVKLADPAEPEGEEDV